MVTLPVNHSNDVFNGNNHTVHMPRRKFPVLLYQMLEDAEKQNIVIDENNDVDDGLVSTPTPSSSFKHIVSWLPGSTKYFKVHNIKLFQEVIMGKYFGRQNHYKSFLRQLNLYGFERDVTTTFTTITPSSTSGGERENVNYRGAYYHPLFERGNIKLCMTMKRLKKSAPASTTTSSSTANATRSNNLSVLQAYNHAQPLKNTNNNKMGNMKINWNVVQQGRSYNEESSPLELLSKMDIKLSMVKNKILKEKEETEESIPMLLPSPSSSTTAFSAALTEEVSLLASSMSNGMIDDIISLFGQDSVDGEQQVKGGQQKQPMEIYSL